MLLGVSQEGDLQGVPFGYRMLSGSKMTKSMNNLSTLKYSQFLFAWVKVDDTYSLIKYLLEFRASNKGAVGIRRKASCLTSDDCTWHATS